MHLSTVLFINSSGMFHQKVFWVFVLRTSPQVHLKSGISVKQFLRMSGGNINFRKNKNWSEKKKREQPKNEGNASTLSEHIDHVLEECSLVFPRTRLWKLEGGRTFSLASKWAIGHKLVSPLTGREVGTR